MKGMKEEERERRALLSQRQSFFPLWTGCDNKKNFVRDMKEKERVRRALLSGACWPGCFKFLVVDMVCRWREMR